MSKQANGGDNIFKRIWTWFKNTAWIQPLLIVGIIFGIIFSIPAISTAINDARERRASANNFYAEYQLSLEGGPESEAQKFIDALATGETAEYGEKFFFMVVQETCGDCENARDALELIVDEYKKDFDNGEFKLYTIFADEDTDNDWEEFNEVAKNAFDSFLRRGENPSFFEDVADRVRDSGYYLNHNLGTSSIEAADDVLERITADSIEGDLAFNTPTIFLYDATDEVGNYGITDAFITVEGSSKYERADTLVDCWNHENKFETDDLIIE
ncbi:MAG: hypothetical protein PHQ38_04465 [Bacilli bacterium]|jgi:thiol-disulfide isomerase/thioredoxin|nr:hypothetical protein [Bacilli bacterium]MDD4521254.1 hypothetical protein [Bacilli bacterium]